MPLGGFATDFAKMADAVRCCHVCCRQPPELSDSRWSKDVTEDGYHVRAGQTLWRAWREFEGDAAGKQRARTARVDGVDKRGEVWVDGVEDSLSGYCTTEIAARRAEIRHTIAYQRSRLEIHQQRVAETRALIRRYQEDLRNLTTGARPRRVAADVNKRRSRHQKEHG